MTRTVPQTEPNSHADLVRSAPYLAHLTRTKQTNLMMADTQQTPLFFSIFIDIIGYFLDVGNQFCKCSEKAAEVGCQLQAGTTHLTPLKWGVDNVL